MYFRIKNDYAAIDITDGDFVMTSDDDSDLEVNHEWPKEVAEAIDVLRAYAAEMQTVAG